MPTMQGQRGGAHPARGAGPRRRIRPAPPVGCRAGAIMPGEPILFA